MVVHKVNKDNFSSILFFLKNETMTSKWQTFTYPVYLLTQKAEMVEKLLLR